MGLLKEPEKAIILSIGARSFLAETREYLAGNSYL